MSPDFSPPPGRPSNPISKFYYPELFSNFYPRKRSRVVVFYQLDGRATTNSRIFFQFPRQLSQFLFSNSIIPPFSTGTNSVAQMIKLVELGGACCQCASKEKERRIIIVIAALWTFFHPACRSLNILTFRQAVVSCGSREEIFKTRGAGKFRTKWIFFSDPFGRWLMTEVLIAVKAHDNHRIFGFSLSSLRHRGKKLKI